MLFCKRKAVRKTTPRSKRIGNQPCELLKIRVSAAKPWLMRIRYSTLSGRTCCFSLFTNASYYSQSWKSRLELQLEWLRVPLYRPLFRLRFSTVTGHMINCLLTEWVGRTGKYLAFGHEARTSPRTVSV